MNTRNLFFIGAAAALTLSGAALADPQAGDPYTQNPTPEERIQTQRLNAQQYDEARSYDERAKAQESANQAAFAQEQQRYDKARARYAAENARYRQERAQYDDERPAAWWRARYERATLDDFYAVPSEALIDLEVVRDDGRSLGRITGVDRRDGRIDRVKIVLADGERAWADADELRYDPQDGILFTDLSRSDLREMARNE
ncbi:MAG TPA: hypothetical protein VG843_00855 [Rhizomicrobium sp.]|nr:hypothetical protein [Rhizomicrobium sp.]